MSKYALEVKHVSKSFRLPTEQANGIKQAFVNWSKGVKGYREQHVLKDISFKVEKGDFFGIVGRNGSGKSTLLKIISQIYTPEKGSVKVNGSLVPFIELGVGFNPELTGRENIYLNGALLGFSHEEISSMYDEIVRFAELEEFMDQKLKNYSSGMQVRLAFSIAIKAQGDILVLDEVLAVGDEAFQKKCSDFFDQIKQDSSKTVILVTHSMADVEKYCNKAIFINDGIIKKTGDVRLVAEAYTDINREYLNVVGHENSKQIDNSHYIEVVGNKSKLKTGDNFVGQIKYKYLGSGEATIAYTLQDELRGGRVFDSGHIEVYGEGSINFCLSLAQFNSTDFRIIATLHESINGKSRMIANTFDGGDFRFRYYTDKTSNDYGLIKTKYIMKNKGLS